MQTEVCNGHCLPALRHILRLIGEPMHHCQSTLAVLSLYCGKYFISGFPSNLLPLKFRNEICCRPGWSVAWLSLVPESTPLGDFFFFFHRWGPSRSREGTLRSWSELAETRSIYFKSFGFCGATIKMQNCTYVCIPPWPHPGLTGRIHISLDICWKFFWDMGLLVSICQGHTVALVH